MTTKPAKRKRPHGTIERLRRYIRLKLVIPVFRSPHPPEYTARGVANGVFWGMTPFIGLQTASMLTTWLVLRRFFNKDSSFVQALIWQWVNNPVTMIPMYYVFFVTGAWLTGSAHSIAGYGAFVALWDRSQLEPTWLTRVGYLARATGIALTVGFIPYALPAAWLSYRWALEVSRARKRRISRAAGSTTGEQARG